MDLDLRSVEYDTVLHPRDGLVINTSTNAGTAQAASGQTISTFLGSLGGAIALFGVQIVGFYLLRMKFERIYRPKSYLPAEKNRVDPPPPGFFAWMVPLFKTSNAELISKCGLDSYFFLRYLRMLLKIFIPLACVVLPVLIPINTRYTKGSAKGLDRLAWSNYDPSHTDRLWAHLILAILVVFWTCYIVYDELRGYIRVRQAYLTSPQHRLRASATTVLVTSIPRKWLTFEALDALYDVFPGGVRNIWINRNFDELAEKISQRDKLAKMLEAAETKLVRDAKAKQVEMRKQAEKKEGRHRTKQDKLDEKAQIDGAAAEMAAGPGVSSGNPHQAHTIDEELGNVSSSEDENEQQGPRKKGDLKNIPVIGQGLGFLDKGLGNVGQGFSKFGKNVLGLPQRLEKTFDEATEGAAFAQMDATADDRRENAFHRDSQEVPLRNGATLDSPTSASYDGSPAPVSATQDFARGSGAGRDFGHTSERKTGIHQPGSTRANPVVEITRPSSGTDPASRPSADTQAGVEKSKDIKWEDEGYMQSQPGRGWKFWKDSSHNMRLPSPQPMHIEMSEYPIDGSAIDAQRSRESGKSEKKSFGSKLLGKLPFTKGEEEVVEEYPQAYDERFDGDKGDDEEPVWKKYVAEKDRSYKRLPPFGLSFLPFMPTWTFLGEKIDVIYYCRKEVARLNLEIERDQQEPQKYPLMNSAFIQFNHQVAAHMACQAVSHHIPNQMAPRIVEISPDDIIWNNMSIKWWERYLRVGIITVLIAGLVIAWAIPVSVTGIISNLAYLEQYKPFGWVRDLPKWFASAVSGVLPWALLGALLAILPIILRFAAKQQGVHTGMKVEMSVQNYYFAFLFVQLFLVVTISVSIFKVLGQISTAPQKTVTILANNVPRAANYFFSYMLLQAFTTSAGALLQVGTLVMWFVVRRLLDNTARQKFARQIKFPNFQWGTFFPVYTNLACIGLIYSVIAPLIVVFNIVTFALFWIAYRYQILYVNFSRFDTGGLLFPTAINQLFTGLYVMELSLIGLYFLVRDKQNQVACGPQAIIMIVVLLFTILYQVMLNLTFSPLYRYMPITLEDDAVRRDEEFARAQGKRWGLTDGADDEEDIEDQLERREQEDESAERLAEEREREDIRERRRSGHLKSGLTRFGDAANVTGKVLLAPLSWADRKGRRRASHVETGDGPAPATNRLSQQSRHHIHHRRTMHDAPPVRGSDLEKGAPDTAQAVGDALFGSFNDEIEDLSPDERDKLVQRAFLHKALRSRRPAIWIPRDDLGVSDDEIRRTQRFSEHVWISNEFTALDQKGRVLFSRAPPDFSEVDLIDL